MRKKGMLLFGAGLMAGLTSTLGFSRAKKSNNTISLPIFYAGTWQYYDKERDRSHKITISPELKLGIDNQIIPATVQQIKPDKLVLITVLFLAHRLVEKVNSHSRFLNYF